MNRKVSRSSQPRQREIVELIRALYHAHSSMTGLTHEQALERLLTTTEAIGERFELVECQH